MGGSAHVREVRPGGSGGTVAGDHQVILAGERERMVDDSRGNPLYLTELIDVLSNFDDVITEKYLGEEEITADDLRSAIRRGTANSGSGSPSSSIGR